MKLLCCMKCFDMFKLKRSMTYCECGKCHGMYIDNITAEVAGPCVSVAIGNGSFVKALRALEMASDKHDREFYYEGDTRVEYCWVRPNSGSGNFYTKEVPYVVRGVPEDGTVQS